jgi:acyl carrier protein
MGMDAVELVIRLEEQFEIEISEDEGIYLFQSPREVIRLVTSRLSGEILPIPDTHAMIERINAALKSLPDYRRRWFRQQLEHQFPAERRDQNWLDFGQALGVELPPLEPQSSGVPRIPTSCANHMRLMFWMMEQRPDCVVWKAKAGQTTAPDNASEWNAASIQTAVFQTISEALGLDPDEMTLDSDMVEDLGMDY